MEPGLGSGGVPGGAGYNTGVRKSQGSHARLVSSAHIRAVVRRTLL